MNKTRIMIVDDEPIVGKRLKRLLEKDGYEVEIFTKGSVALEECDRKHFDIVITDLKMGGVDGMKVLETVRGKNPDTKVIIITGFRKMESSNEAFIKGAFDYLVKPFKIEDLKRIIKKAESELKNSSGQ
jgi:DNA-binding NtrC family response regulator